MNWQNVTLDTLTTTMYHAGTHLLVDDAVEVVILDNETLAWRTNTEEMDGDWQIGTAEDVAAELP